MILVMGLSHKTAPVHVREKFAIGEAALPEVLARLADGQSIQSVKASLNSDGLFFFAIN